MIEMDTKNFQFELNCFDIEMKNGQLIINNVLYENNEDDPTYDLVIELAFIKGLLK